jgi:uncharacterized damage-inducible protein DinB
MVAESEQLALALADIGRQVLRELSDLPENVLNRSVELPEANTLFALATHLVGAAEFWAVSVAGARKIDRDRAAEFVASGTYADLERRYSAWMLALDDVLSRRSTDELNQHVELPPEQRDTLGSQQPTLRACVLHAIEHSALHLGHIQLTRALLVGST